MTARYLARSADGEPLLGNETGYVPLAAVDPSLSSIEDALRIAPDGLPDPADASARLQLEEHISFGAPLSHPGKLFGIGLNYADHATDLDEARPDEPASFFKPPTALTGPGGPIRLPPIELTDRVTAEAELAVVIGQSCSDVSDPNVEEVVAGYVPVIDVTAEDILERNPRFLTRAKSFDTFLVIGPAIVVPAPHGDLALDNLDSCTVRTTVNDEVIAENTVSNMHFSPRELVAFHSRVMTLEPGDVISTGTPGAGVIQPDDSVCAEVEGIGSVGAGVVRDSDGHNV